jgi:site-specific recombinase XerD
MPRVEQRLPEYLSNDQAAQLLRAVQYNIRDHAFVSTLLYTGVRCAELINLDIDDIDFQENIVKVRQGKGKKDRIIPLAPQLRDAIRNYIKYRMDTNQNTIDGSKALFVTSRCNPKRLSGTTIRKLLIQYAAKAGLSHLHPHKLRHTALTEIYRKTKDLYYTSLIAGHSGVAITQRYAHSDPNYLKEIYNKSNIGYGATQQSNIPKPELPQQQRPDRTGYQ